MARYILQNLTLEVQLAGRPVEPELTQLLRDLSWVRADGLRNRPSLCLWVTGCDDMPPVPQTARLVFQVGGLCGWEDGEALYLTEGSSRLQLWPSQGQAVAQLTPAFVGQPRLMRQRFWTVGLLKLLRPWGLYGLHAAGVVSQAGQGLLLIGPSGSGKSTLALGLVRHGWGYLSDDLVLVRRQPTGVEALTGRKPFSVDDPSVPASADQPWGTERPIPVDRRKRRVDIEETFPRQAMPGCIPQLLLFPQIVPDGPSRLRPLDTLSALKRLLAQSGPPLFDRTTMGAHLEVLTQLVQQTTRYELQAGLDLYQQPLRLASLLAEHEGEARWRAW